jgi:acyl CoA:acetate/3-ketoacid CoA transferase alpha subunit
MFMHPDESFISLMVTPLLPIKLPACVPQMSILQLMRSLLLNRCIQHAHAGHGDCNGRMQRQEKQAVIKAHKHMHAFMCTRMRASSTAHPQPNNAQT